MATLYKFILVLLWPVQLAKVVAFANAIITALTNNPYFPNPSPGLPVIETDIAAFAKALAARKSRAAGTAEVLKAAGATLKKDLQHLMAWAQSVIDNADPSLWAVMGASSGFQQQKAGKRVKLDVSLKWGDVSGWVVIAVRSLGPDTTYFFQVSTDQKNWTSLTPTHKATATAKGLTPGVTYWFRFQTLSGKPEQMSDWSQEYSIIVK